MNHFLSLADLTGEQLASLLDLSAKVKANPSEYASALAGQSLAMIFQKSSTRTRVSFEVGVGQLGGRGLFLSSKDLQLGRGETVADTGKVLSRYVDGIMARVFAHDDLHELAKGSVPVINGLSDLLHPCQVVADLLTLKEQAGNLEGRVLAYVGDGNNVAHSLINGCVRCGVEIRIATPPGYEPDQGIVDAGRELGTVDVTNDPAAAVLGADAIYTDVWASMGQEEERAKRLKDFADYQVNMELFEQASPDAIFLHCLPAHRGEEVTDEVVDHERSAVLDEAENRLHAQKAIMLWLMGGHSID